MNDSKKYSSTVFFIIGLIFFNVFLYKDSIFAQPNSKYINSTATTDLSLPLKLCLDKTSDKISVSRIASDNSSSLFAAFSTGRIEKLHLLKNYTTWTSELGGEIVSEPVYDNDKVYVVTKILINESTKGNVGGGQATNYTLWSIDAGTGITVWQFHFAATGYIYLNDFQNRLFLTVNDGTIISINKFDAQKFYYKNIGVKFSSIPSFSEGKIYIATNDNSIVILSADNGEIVSKITTLQSSATTMIIDGDKLYWGEKEGFVNLINLSNKSRTWSIRQGGEISNLALVPGGVLVSSLDNFIYLISPQKGRKIWKRRLSGRILAKPLITRGFVTFATVVDQSAVVLDLRDGKIVNRISLENKGFILSAPQIVGNLLVFLTSKGIFAFDGTGFNCSAK
jgi:hypothetical protein